MRTAIDKKWPKQLPTLTEEQNRISNDFMEFWHTQLSKNYGIIDRFNHGYAVKNCPQEFVSTLEIGAGLGEHLKYERLTEIQKNNYHAIELRKNMADHIKSNFPFVNVAVGDCQEKLNYADNSFDRVLAIHVLEHLPNLPAAVKEIHRVCNKDKGIFSVVIPCEGGLAYSMARKISAQRLFEKRYKQSYRWFIEKEHINVPREIIEVLDYYFITDKQTFFPLRVPAIHLNLCIGLTLRPRRR